MSYFDKDKARHDDLTEQNKRIPHGHSEIFIQDVGNSIIKTFTPGPYAIRDGYVNMNWDLKHAFDRLLKEGWEITYRLLYKNISIDIPYKDMQPRLEETRPQRKGDTFHYRMSFNYK